MHISYHIPFEYYTLYVYSAVWGRPSDRSAGLRIRCIRLAGDGAGRVLVQVGLYTVYDMWCVCCMHEVCKGCICRIYIYSVYMCLLRIYEVLLWIHGTTYQLPKSIHIYIIHMLSHTFTHIYQHIHVYIDMLISPTKPFLYSHNLWPVSDPSAGWHPQKSTSFRNWSFYVYCPM